MEQEVMDTTRICQRAPSLASRTYENERPWPLFMAMGLIIVLLISTPLTYPFWAPLFGGSEDVHDVLILAIDQDGNLVQHVTYPANMRDGCPTCPKITELTTFMLLNMEMIVQRGSL